MQTWPTYVRAIAGNINSAIARTTGLSQPSVSRWFKGSLPDPSSAATFARKYDRPVLEAFIAAGFLTPEDAKQRPAAAPSMDSLTDDELLEEVARRMREGGTDAGTAEAGEKSSDGPAPVSIESKRDQMIRETGMPGMQAAQRGKNPANWA